MLFLWGLGGHAGFDINAQKPLEDTGRNLSADVLSFGGIVFGSFTGVSALFVQTALQAPNLQKSVGAGGCRLQLPSPCRHVQDARVHPHVLRPLHSHYIR